MSASAFELSSLVIHVWAVRLDASDEVCQVYRAFLSPEETAHADRFAFQHLKRRFEVSHGVLRLLLSCYLKYRPGDLLFDTGPRGKPALRGEDNLRFNLSHSADLGVYAFARDCELGVDVEQVKEIKDVETIASRYFCEEESSELLQLDDDIEKRHSFYRCWTRKEAYIKAVGTGLYLPLDQFRVTFLQDDQPRFLHIGKHTNLADEWTLQHLEPATGYVGAIAYHGSQRKIFLNQVQAPMELIEVARKQIEFNMSE